MWLTIKNKLLYGWSLMRFIRVALGVFILIEGFKSTSYFSLAIGGLLLWQGVMNVGCCGANGCDTNVNYNKDQSLEDVGQNTSYEEIK